jgi:hypothetical protein
MTDASRSSFHLFRRLKASSAPVLAGGVAVIDYFPQGNFVAGSGMTAPEDLEACIGELPIGGRSPQLDAASTFPGPVDHFDLLLAHTVLPIC